MGSQAPLGKQDLFKTPGVELPGYIREIARALMRNGKSKSNAIQIAIGTVKRWAAGGHGVNPDTQAKAARALAQWEAAKAKARATPNKSDHSNPVYAPGQRVIFLANDKAKDKKSKSGARDGDKGSLPPGATGWKHGWIPVDDSGKAVGPAQKPKWLRDAEAKHKAAGGRTVEQIEAEKLKNAQDARKRKAEAPAKKAEAEAKRTKAEAERKANAAKRDKEQKAKQAERATEEKAKARERQIQAAYRQALQDRKAGRELSEQQRRVVAYVEANQRKEQGKLRKVDVPGADGSSVSKTAPAKKGALPASDAKKGDGKTIKRPAKPVVKTAAQIAREKQRAEAKRRRDARYSVKSYRSGRAPQTRNFANEGVYTNVLDFAKNPAGQLAFRYKHGWILINPAIPSRGHLGGAIARKHGVKSGTVTHGHFVDAGGGKKKFVPTRSGGENNPAKLKAAHAKGRDLTGAPADKSKYGLTAAMKDTGGSALSPTKPTPEQVKAKKDAATKAAVIAQKSKSLADAQVAAKKYADAFVAQKKAGDLTGAEHSKNSAQAWAKKAQQIKQAEAASAKAKAKYEAEQKAKAEADKAAAEQAKLEAEKAAKQKKKQALHDSLDNITAAEKLEKLADEKGEKTVPELKAKAQQYKYAADAWKKAIDHQAENGITVGDPIKAKLKDAEDNAAKYAKAAVEKKKAIQEAQQLAVDAYDASDDANESKSAEDYNKAAHAHQKAGKAFADLGMTNEHTMHYDKASQLMKKYHAAKADEDALAQMTGAPKAQSKPDAGPGMAKAEANGDKADAISSVIDGLPEEAGGSLAKWDDYLHAAYAAKADPTPANLKKLKAATEALKADGADLGDIKAATSSLFKKAGFTKTAAKKTVAQKKAAAPKPKAEEKPAPKAEDYKVTLPGPGMYKDGNAVTNAYKAAAAETDPAVKAAKLQAAENAAAAFEAKHGKAFDKSKVETFGDLDASPVAPFTPQSGGHAASHPFWKTAEDEGYQPVPSHVSANGDWKPSQVPGLKSNKGAYTYSGGSYTAINAHLRSGGDPTKGHYAASVAQMDKEFAAVPGLDHDIVTIRKMADKGPFNDAPPYMEPGGVFEDKGYSSTSKDPGAWYGGVAMQVRIPKGSKVLDLNHTTGSQHSHEQEILLNRGSKYKIVSDGPGHNGQGRLIVVELVQ